MHFLLRQPGGVLNGLLNILPLQIRVAIKNFLKSCAMRYLPDNNGNGNPHVSDARPPAHDIR